MHVREPLARSAVAEARRTPSSGRSASSCACTWRTCRAGLLCCLSAWPPQIATHKNKRGPQQHARCVVFASPPSHHRPRGQSAAPLPGAQPQLQASRTVRVGFLASVCLSCKAGPPDRPRCPGAPAAREHLAGPKRLGAVSRMLCEWLALAPGVARPPNVALAL